MVAKASSLVLFSFFRVQDLMASIPLDSSSAALPTVLCDDVRECTALFVVPRSKTRF